MSSQMTASAGGPASSQIGAPLTTRPGTSGQTQEAGSATLSPDRLRLPRVASSA